WASSTAGLAKFSDAISSIWRCARPTSPWIAAAISGSRSPRRRSKKSCEVSRWTAAWVKVIEPPKADGSRLRHRLGHLGDAAGVATSGEGGVEEGQQAVARHLETDQTRAEREDVGVVVLPGEPRGGHVVAHRGANPRVAVGGHRDADAAAARHDTELRP